MNKDKKEKAERILSPITTMMEGFAEGISQKEKESDPIPWERATIRKEFKRCYNNSCKCNSDWNNQRPTHGPYLYAYWKDKGKLNKKYIGRSVEEYNDKLHMMAYNQEMGRNWTMTQWSKYDYINLVADCGSKLQKSILAN